MRNYFIFFVCFTAIGCGMDDQDRCLDGYYFEAESNHCRPIVEEEECGQGANVPEGFGTVCTEQDDCASFSQASVCQNENPMNLEGYCTYRECSPGGCPSCFQCCDCSTESETKPTVCLSDQDAELAINFAGCVCD
jgi:hypothetical protein